MKKSLIFVICVFVFVLGCNLLPNGDCVRFNIGEKVESDADRFVFTSGIYAYGNLKNLTEIFDGNLSTGIDYKNNSQPQIYFELHFSYPLYINNLTIKPYFGGGKSLYQIFLKLHEGVIILSQNQINETFLQLNCSITYLELYIWPNMTGHFNFNDVIINYTQSSSNLEGVQKQINKINQDINLIHNDIIVMKNDIIDIKENITDIKNNMPSEYNDSALQDQINNLTQEIDSLKENLTRINNSLHLEYNDSAIKTNIFTLESENIFIKQQIGNLTIKINNLTTELEKISSEVQNLQGVGGDKNNDSKENNKLQEYTYPITFGIIIIILLLIILKLSLTILKRKQHDREEPRSDEILMSKLKYDILTNKEIKDSRLYDDEYKKLLENGYRKDEMSQETYNYIKTVLEVSEKPQNLKNKRT